ncbi:MAG: polyphosphate kinase 1, partial [Janthinobacterium lividum]
MAEISTSPYFFDRDLSWLFFNERILQEAAKDTVPLLERIKFLSIFSSNLDEFYRVRMPILLALKKIGDKNSIDTKVETDEELLNTANHLILKQQQLFGEILLTSIIPS